MDLIGEMMPFKNREDKQAYQREWYLREGNRQRTIEKVRERKKNEYGGKCVVCGADTVGETKGKTPRFCKDHRREQWVEKEIIAAGGKSPWDQEGNPDLGRLLAQKKSRKESFSSLKINGPRKWANE